MKMNNKVCKKILSSLLASSMMFAMCSCDIAKDIRQDIANRMDINAKELSSQEIVRNIVNAINDNSLMAESYSAIPESQLDGVSYSVYFEYVNMLRSFTSQYSRTVSYFRSLSSNEVKSLVGDNLFTLYPGLACFELQFSDREGNIMEVEDPIYIYLIDGTYGASLSNRWITGTLDIYNYADHYFTMIDEQNTDGVVALLEPGFISYNYSDSVIRSMANQLVDYYRVDVKSSREQYRVTLITPSNFNVRIPETIGDGDDYTEHIVQVYRETSDIYRIQDIVPFSIDESMLYLNTNADGNSMTLLKVGLTYSRNAIVFNLGNPKYEFVRTDDVIFEETAEGETVTLFRTIVIYDSINLVFYASLDNDGWNGQLVSATLRNSDLYIGESIYVGMTKTEFLEKYPFMDEFGYEHLYSDSTGDYLISFVFNDNEILSEISLSRTI